jgi:DNA-binding response OmpR family regulator
MDNKNDVNPIILVVEDVEETREGIEKLLIVDGYRLALARDEQDGIESARRQRPGLILVSLAGFSKVQEAGLRKLLLRDHTKPDATNQAHQERAA